MWDGIRNSIEKINNKTSEYGKDFMKTKFNSYNNLPLSKTVKFHEMILVAQSVFEEDNKYYLQVFLDECLYEL